MSERGGKGREGGGEEREREEGRGKGRRGKGGEESHLSIDIAALIQKQLHCRGVSVHSGQHQWGYPQLATSPMCTHKTHIKPHPPGHTHPPT